MKAQSLSTLKIYNEEMKSKILQIVKQQRLLERGHLKIMTPNDNELIKRKSRNVKLNLSNTEPYKYIGHSQTKKKY